MNFFMECLNKCGYVLGVMHPKMKLEGQCPTCGEELLGLRLIDKKTDLSPAVCLTIKIGFSE